VGSCFKRHGARAAARFEIAKRDVLFVNDGKLEGVKNFRLRS
jgi:hypothetical protein